VWLDEETPIRKQNLVLKKSFINSAGTLGFVPDIHQMPFLSQLGAFITNPISRLPRKPADNRAFLPFPGGFLLHTGLPNPGISRTIAACRRRWADAPLPVIVHLLAETHRSLGEMVHKLEGLENILAIELGLPPLCERKTLEAFADAASGELPVIICLQPEQIPSLLDPLTKINHSAVHLTAPRGMLPDGSGRLVAGRLFGKGIYPMMLNTAHLLVNAELRVIADGGVFARWQADALLDIGVMAVGLGSVLWQVRSETLFT
jgi:dihydroorotate dehydrogenase